MTAPGPFIHLCSVPGCREWGTYGFKAGGIQKWACLAHRARGQAWHEKMKAGAGALPVERQATPKPVQGTLL